MQHPNNVQEDSDAQARALEMQRRIGRMITKQGRAATLADLMTPTASGYLRCHGRRARSRVTFRQRRPGCERRPRARARRTARRNSSRAGPDDGGGEPGEPAGAPHAGAVS